MRILGINGSPRKDGNTRYMLEVVLKESGIEDRKIIDLVDYDIKPCNACGECWKTKKCPVKDDLEIIIEEMVKSDAIVIASPVYYGVVSAQMKAFIDRTGEILGARGFPLKGKVGAAISVARRWGHLSTINALLLYLLQMRMIVPGAGWCSATAKERGDIIKDEEGLERAKELGKIIGELCRKLS